jgi:archaellum component FlaG (FlaF/FlaG flagellin family)
MGLSLTGTRVLYFITTVIIAGLVSGVIYSVSSKTSESLCDKEERIQCQLDLDFKIINDPYHIPTSGNYRLFYLKNIGERKMITTNDTFQIFLNGDLLSTTNYYFSDSQIESGKVTNLYITSSEISYGDHRLRLIGPQALNDEFVFTI